MARKMTVEMRARQRAHEQLVRMHERETREYGGFVDETEIREWEDMAVANQSELWAMPLFRMCKSLMALAQHNVATERMLTRIERTQLEEKHRNAGWS